MNTFTTNTTYAHTPQKDGHDKWHHLEDHLVATARQAALFARAFGCERAGFTLGIYHDLGKANPAFQEYLKACARGEQGKRIPHSVGGASYLWRTLLCNKPCDSTLAICALGHHGGLPSEADAITIGGKLHQWWHDLSNDRLKKLIRGALQNLPLKNPESLPNDNLRRELRLRMLFSALVDADFLDTEKHFDPKRFYARAQWTQPADLWPVFRANQLRMMWEGRKGHVNRVRRQIYFACIRTAIESPGLFRLTVPTGGGKTRSGLAFALKHANIHKQHGFRRVIIALPYTSIIDQNAQVYRQIFGSHFVLEHHSQMEIPEIDRQDESYLRQRLAAENWDSPLIVTTTVQLLESLFANKPSRCRKLHNIARSIIILDEVQTLPPELLEPTMDVLRALVDEYGVTIVFSTATQPALDKTPYLKSFENLNIREIVPNFESQFQVLERVEYQPVRHYATLAKLAGELAKPENSQGLVILNTRKHALALHADLQSYKAEGLYHLSTLLCSAHRKRVLREVTERLAGDKQLPVRLISTQVVEAGVDLDFPVVYRVIGPLDRIVQAAGRCDREGKRTAKGRKGRVVIFDFPDNASPPGAYKTGLEDAKTLLGRNPPKRLHDPKLYNEYFQMLFRDVNLDKKKIQPYRHDLNYPKVAEKYKLIEDTIPVVVPSYDNHEGGRRLKEHLENPSRDTWRKLMPFIINLSHRDLHRQEISECLTEVSPYLFRWDGSYDDITHRGIQNIVRDPADLYVGE